MNVCSGICVVFCDRLSGLVTNKFWLNAQVQCNIIDINYCICDTYNHFFRTRVYSLKTDSFVFEKI